MLLISLSRTLPKLIASMCFIPLIYFIYFVGDIIVDAQMRLAALLACIGVLAWLPWVFDKFGWLELTRRGERLISTSSRNGLISYEKVINFGLLIFGPTSIILILVWKWAISNLGFNPTAILLFACGWFVFEHSIFEVKKKRG